MDRTAEFLAVVKAVQQLSAPASGDAGRGEASQRRPARPGRERDGFLREADKIMASITALHSDLLRMRQAYLRLGAPVQAERGALSGAGAGDGGDRILGSLSLAEIQAMSEEQKDKLDMQIQTIIKGYLAMIQSLARLADTAPAEAESAKPRGLMAVLGVIEGGWRASPTARAQTKALRESVIWILEQRLMTASRIQQDMQQYRLQRNIARQESLLIKDLPRPGSALAGGQSIPLDSNTSVQAVSGAAASFVSPLGRLIPPAVKSRVAAAIPTAFGGSSQASDANADPTLRSRLHNRHQSPFAAPQSAAGWTTSNPGALDFESDSEPELTPQQRRLLEADNAAMLEELDGTLNLVRNATQSLNEIAHLQSTLAHHLQAQSEVIEAIHVDAVQAADNIRKGNEQLLSAKKHFGGPRYWVLFFMIGASVLLLFFELFA
ncbi:syntaxin ufe1 [Polyrhizophydium stewartii]|uniref:Syntaxin ufe1 n=1 Tax=Polyrhizophydium stewartii TaxID=2732419 RepID=A0ABR4N8M4_9FUNG